MRRGAREANEASRAAGLRNAIDRLVASPQPAAQPFNAATLAQIAAVRPDLLPGMHGATQPAAQPEHYQAQVERLVDDMAAAGLVLTVEQQPLHPLAMGHYRTVVSVRRARGAA